MTAACEDTPQIATDAATREAPKNRSLAGLFCECLFHFGDPDGPI